MKHIALLLLVLSFLLSFAGYAQNTGGIKANTPLLTIDSLTYISHNDFIINGSLKNIPKEKGGGNAIYYAIVYLNDTRLGAVEVKNGVWEYSHITFDHSILRYIAYFNDFDLLNFYSNRLKDGDVLKAEIKYNNTTITAEKRITLPLLDVILTTDSALSFPVGESFKVTASASKEDDIEYQFLKNADNSEDWSVVQDFSKSNILETVAEAGGSLIRTIARDTTNNTEKSNVIKVETIDTLTALEISTDLDSFQYVDTLITLFANARGGADNEYRFSIYGDVFTVIQNYSTYSYCSWEPVSAGDYILKVDVRSRSNPKNEFSAEKKFLIQDYAKTTNITSLTLSSDSKSPMPKSDRIEFVATAVGGEDIEYEFSVLDETGLDKIWQDKKLNTFSWRPSSIGDFTIKVTAKEKDSSVVLEDTMPFTITKSIELSGVSLQESPPSPKLPMTDIYIRAIPKSGIIVYYKFELFDGDEWQILSDYDKSTAYTWTPEKEGDYLIKVSACEADGFLKAPDSEYGFFARGSGIEDKPNATNTDVGFTDITIGKKSERPTVTLKEDATVYSNTISYTIGNTEEKPVQIDRISIAPNIASPQLAGSVIKFLTDVRPLSKEFEYEYSVTEDYGKNWTVLQGFSTDRYCSWQPKKYGNYIIMSKVRQIGFDETYSVILFYNIGQVILENHTYVLP